MRVTLADRAVLAAVAEAVTRSIGTTGAGADRTRKTTVPIAVTDASLTAGGATTLAVADRADETAVTGAVTVITGAADPIAAALA